MIHEESNTGSLISDVCQTKKIQCDLQSIQDKIKLLLIPNLKFLINSLFLEVFLDNQNPFFMSHRFLKGSGIDFLDLCDFLLTESPLSCYIALTVVDA